MKELIETLKNTLTLQWIISKAMQKKTEQISWREEKAKRFFFMVINKQTKNEWCKYINFFIASEKKSGVYFVTMVCDEQTMIFVFWKTKHENYSVYFYSLLMHVYLYWCSRARTGSLQKYVN
jgi:hypothetical protein